MKQSLFFLPLIFKILSAQIIFQDRFNNLTLSTYTTLYTTTLYTTVPSSYLQLNEGFPNTAGSSLHPNAPFHTDSLRYKGWGIVYNNIVKDTFLVSTSWTDSNRVTSRWVILPPISGISVNSVLHWNAMAPDPANADGYAVYISNNTAINDTVIFNNSNKVLQILDNTAGGTGENAQWTRRSISLANYAGQSIRIAFKNISQQKFQLWIDDITIENLSYATDASIENIGNSKYLTTNQPFYLSARIKNNGYQNISNVNLAYSIQSISYNNQSFGLNNALLPLSTTTLAFTNTLTINTPGMYKVKIWINQVNGITDQNHFNDTISYYLSVINNSVTPKILVEQITDASMPDAPANQDTLNDLTLQDTNIIAVQIHSTDSLICNISNVFTNYFQLPDNSLSAMLNRTYLFNDNTNYFFRNDFRSKINLIKNNVSPCKIYFSNVVTDTNFRTIQADVNVQFLQNTYGDYRVGVYLIENNVCGNPTDTSINGYNQLSSFYFTPFSNYYQTGYYSAAADAFVLNAYQYKHRYVLSQALTPLLGDASVVPNNPTNVIYTQTYSLTVPASANGVFRYHFNNLYLVAYVYEHDTLPENRKILNAALYKVTNAAEMVHVPDITNHTSIVIYPNPATDYLFIETNSMQNLNAEIVNVLGQKVLEVKSKITDVSMLPEGVYFVRIQQGSAWMVKKIVINR